MPISDIPAPCSRSVRIPAVLDDSLVTAALPSPETILDMEGPLARASIGYVSEIETGTAWGFQGLSSNEQDDMGMSVGILQWNFGGSAQAVFRSISKPVIVAAMPHWGETFWNAIHDSENSLRHARSLQDNIGSRWTFKQHAEAEIQAFLITPEGIAAQKATGARMLTIAYFRAAQWAAASRAAGAPSNREVTYFLDLQVFSGGNLTGVWVPAAAKLRRWFADDGAMIGFVGDWLTSCPWYADSPQTGLFGKDDAVASSAAWKAAYPIGQGIADDKALLFAHGFVRALANRGPLDDEDRTRRGIFKAQVLCRHGVTALGAGRANGVSWPGGVLDQ